MKIEAFMTRDVGCCHPDDPLTKPCQIMWENNCGFVPIVDQEKRLVGVITDRDVCMAAYTQGRPVQDIPTKTAMARLVYYCRASDSLATVESLMRRRRIRRVPVVDHNERVIGVVSLGDLARHYEHASQRRAAGLTVGASGVTEAEVAATLASVSHGRSRFNDVTDRTVAT